MKKPITEREQIVSVFVKREIEKDTAATLWVVPKERSPLIFKPILFLEYQD